jgi:PHP family Zn ribbon phosphoesterase
MNRVDELADRPMGVKPTNAAPFKKLVELDKIIAEAMDIKSRSSNKVQNEYRNLIKQGGNELNILLNLGLKDLEKMTDPAVVEGIKRVREGKLIIKPGFDGQYGEIRIFSEQEKKKNKQKSLFE